MFGTAALTTDVSYKTCMQLDQPIVIMEIRHSLSLPTALNLIKTT
jgi:hypothetical protein